MIKRKDSWKKAFTLVELIIVITILTILATIAFVSFWKYANQSRDANRVATIQQIEKALNLHFINTGYFPEPQDIYLSGSYNTTHLTNVGYINDTLAGILKLSKAPIDPLFNDFYTYATSTDRKFFQVAWVLESPIAGVVWWVNAKTYKSVVKWNYNWLYKKSWYIYNFPSLIPASNWDLWATLFVVNNWLNLPVSIANKVWITNTEDVATSLQKVGSTANSITGVVIPENYAQYNTNSWTLVTSLWYSQDVIGEKIYGKDYFTGNIWTSSGWAWAVSEQFTGNCLVDLTAQDVNDLNNYLITNINDLWWADGFYYFDGWWTEVYLNDIWSLTKEEWCALTELQAWANFQVTQIPSAIWKLSNLTSLHLWYINLSVLPDSIWNLSNLQNLTLDGNNITSLPASIWNLTQLRSFSAAWNGLTDLPKEFTQLVNLQNIFLEDNNLTYEAFWENNLYKFDSLTQVTLFNISNNPSLWTLSASYRSSIALTNFEQFYYSGNNFSVTSNWDGSPIQFVWNKTEY